MFMWYLGGRIGHRATHLASSAVSSEELGDKTSNWEESGGGDSEKGRNQPQGGDLEFEEDKDERYGYGNEDEEEEEGEDEDEVMEEIWDDKDDKNKIDPLDNEYGEL